MKYDNILYLYFRLYIPGSRNENFGVSELLKWMFLGIIHSLITFYGPFLAWQFNQSPLVASGHPGSMWMASLLSYSAIVMVISFLMLYYAQEWSWLTIISIVLLNLAIYFAFMFIYNLIPATSIYLYAVSALDNLSFWLALLLIVALCIAPVVAYEKLKDFLFPSLLRILQLSRKSWVSR